MSPASPVYMLSGYDGLNMDDDFSRGEMASIAWEICFRVHDA
jgi:hypothetical protein